MVIPERVGAVRQIGIPNNVAVDVGPARLGVMTLAPGPPPRARIAVMPHTDPYGGDTIDVELGGAFPASGTIWRFVEVTGGEAAGDRWVVVLAEDSPGPGLAPQLRPFGRLDEAGLRAIEANLAHPLPPVYRRWLAQTNGLQPVGDHHVPGLLITLYPERPLLGSHPDHPARDLLTIDRSYRRGWLPMSYLVIAVPDGGLLAVRSVDPGADLVVLLPEPAMTGQFGDAADLAREQHLEPVARNIDAFIERLRPA